MSEPSQSSASAIDAENPWPWEFFHHRDDRLLDRDGLGVVPVLSLSRISRETFAPSGE